MVINPSVRSDEQDTDRRDFRPRTPQDQPPIIPSLKDAIGGLERLARDNFRTDEDIEEAIDKCSLLVNKANHLRNLLDRKARGDFHRIKFLF